jgi:hypothetical protein
LPHCATKCKKEQKLSEKKMEKIKLKLQSKPTHHFPEQGEI